MNPFEYLNAINMSKKDIMVDDIAESKYVPFMVNRSLSYFQDTALIANEMNVNHQIDNRLQFDFYINTVRKRKRFSKWIKPTVMDDITTIKEFYGYNNIRAEEALKLLSKDQISVLRDKVNPGGKQ